MEQGDLRPKDMHQANRLSWNEATAGHNSHRGDQAAFFRGGGSTLFPEEMELLGDITGLSALHLQCNVGQDTLSLAQLGATVTGVDISDEAINYARNLASEAGIAAQFVRADIYDWFLSNETQFDIVFSSYGAVPWLSDLKAWGVGIAQALQPGGRFVLVEYHPLLATIDDDEWVFRYDYMGGRVERFEDGISDYVAESGDQIIARSQMIPGVQDFKNPHPAYEFFWGVGEIVSALIDGGLMLTALHEYPYTNGWKALPDMREAPGRRNYPPENVPTLPLMFGLAAQKPATSQTPPAARPYEA